ncbi:hypothetical protein GCM10020370_50080 [Paenibacillus hodogayensis]
MRYGDPGQGRREDKKFGLVQFFSTKDAAKPREARDWRCYAVFASVRGTDRWYLQAVFDTRLRASVKNRRGSVLTSPHIAYNEYISETQSNKRRKAVNQK